MSTHTHLPPDSQQDGHHTATHVTWGTLALKAQLRGCHQKPVFSLVGVGVVSEARRNQVPPAERIVCECRPGPGAEGARSLGSGLPAAVLLPQLSTNSLAARGAGAQRTVGPPPRPRPRAGRGHDCPGSGIRPRSRDLPRYTSAHTDSLETPGSPGFRGWYGPKC